jgi:hypothetical protein
MATFWLSAAGFGAVHPARAAIVATTAMPAVATLNADFIVLPFYMLLTGHSLVRLEG